MSAAFALGLFNHFPVDGGNQLTIVVSKFHSLHDEDHGAASASFVKDVSNGGCGVKHSDPLKRATEVREVGPTWDDEQFKDAREKDLRQRTAD